MSKKENESKYIYVKGEKIYVTEEVYKAYMQERNYARYLNRKDVKNKVYGFDDYNIRIEDIPDEDIDIEKIIKTKMRIDDLYKAIEQLNDDEKSIIYSLFFEEKSIRDLAKLKNVSTKKIFSLKTKILQKLKELLE